ncbi:MAG: hypothetical protein HWE25_08390 [Alphaproteobacteria bacterium]|nr:hypothetical protein [Alphaproteobacteria bacterium]
MADKYYCNACAGKRNHSILAEHKYRHDIDDGYGDLWVEYEYLTIQCAGCDNISFLKRSLFSEDIYPISEHEDHAHWDETIYPSPLYRSKPDWFDDLPDETLQQLFEEVYKSLAAETHFLATFGSRTILDRLIVLTVGDQGNFYKGIKALQDCGKLSDHEKEILEPTLEAGHAAAHRGYVASSDQLSTILDTIEGLVHRLLVLPARSEALGDAVPSRGKGKKPKSTASVPTISDKIMAAKSDMKNLIDQVTHYLKGLGDDVKEVPQKHYVAFKRNRNFASLQLKVKNKVIVLYLNIDPDNVEIEEGFTRDVRAIGHYGTGHLEVLIRSEEELGKSKPLILKSYEES